MNIASTMNIASLLLVTVATSALGEQNVLSADGEFKLQRVINLSTPKLKRSSQPLSAVFRDLLRYLKWPYHRLLSSTTK